MLDGVDAELKCTGSVVHRECDAVTSRQAVATQEALSGRKIAIGESSAKWQSTSIETLLHVAAGRPGRDLIDEKEPKNLLCTSFKFNHFRIALRSDFLNMKIALFLAALVASVQAQNTDPSFDHQTKTYKATFTPVSVQGEDLTLTPFFSPDHSIDTLVDLINQAKTSIDIQTPGMSSWVGCSYGTTCIGCSVEQQSAETFPAFPALLNAVHRGVTVRIITNNYGDVVCDGDIDIATFFALNNITIKWYTVRCLLLFHICF